MLPRQILILSCSLLGLISCKKDPCITDHEQFTEEERSWIVYNVGDTIIYQNNLADKDTFVVYLNNISNHEQIDPSGSFKPTCYYPITGIYKMVNSDSSLSAELCINKDKTSETHFHKLPAIADFRTNLKALVPVERSIIDSIEYLDVYEVKRDYFQVGIKTTVNAIKFNKTYGFIQYEMADGTLWTLFKIILK